MEKKEINITYEKSKNYFEAVACDFSSATTNIGITKLYFIDEDSAPTSATLIIEGDKLMPLQQKPFGTKIINGCVTIPTVRIPDLVALLQKQYELSQNPPKGDE